MVTVEAELNSLAEILRAKKYWQHHDWGSAPEFGHWARATSF